jgi:glucosamine-6-phosphate deaminase
VPRGHLRVDSDAQYTVSSRSASPDLVPDRMAERIDDPTLLRRLTPNPEQQQLHNSVPRTTITA